MLEMSYCDKETFYEVLRKMLHNDETKKRLRRKIRHSNIHLLTPALSVTHGHFPQIVQFDGSIFDP